MTRLPTPGQDDGVWGTILNDYLSVEHNTDGSLKRSADIDTAKSTAQAAQQAATNAQSQLIAKAPLASPTFTGTVTVPVPTSATDASTKGYVDSTIASAVTNGATPDATTAGKGSVQLAGDLSGTASNPTVPGLAGKEPTITTGTTTQYYRGDKTWQTLDKSAVGLSNLDNTSDTNKPLSSAMTTALGSKLDVSTVTTKGDLLAATAASTLARVGIGADGQVLTADTASTAGIKWASTAASPQYPNSSGAATVVPRPTVFDVRDYGAAGDGATDDTVAIRAALSAASAAGGGTVQLKPGLTYIYGGGGTGLGIDIPTNVILDGGGTAKIVRNNWTINGGFIRIRGALASSATTALAANGAPGALTLVVASTTGIAASDYFLLGSTTLFSPTSNNTRGEIVHIKSVDSPTQLTIWEPLCDTYLTSANAAIYRITHSVAAGIVGVQIDDSQPDGHKTGFIEVQHARSVAIDVVCTHAGGASVLLDNVIDSTIKVFASEQKDDTTNGWFGYGVNCSNSCQNLRILASGVRVRHIFTTTGGGGGRMGVPRGITVTGSARACTAPAYDTHPDGEAIIFNGCTVVGSQHAGIQLRSPNTHAVHNVISWCGTGIQFIGGAHGCAAQGNTIRHITDTGIGGQGYGIRLSGDGTTTGPNHPTILNNLIEDTAYASIGFLPPDNAATGFDAQNVRVERNELRNAGQAGAFGYGVHAASSITTAGNWIESNTFEALTTSAENNDSGSGMTYMINVPITYTASYFLNNLGLGLVTGLINDAAGAGTTNMSHNNHRMDQPAEIVAFRQTTQIQPASDAAIGLILRPNSGSQTGNLLEIRNSTGGQIGRINSVGEWQVTKLGNHSFGGPGISNVMMALGAGSDTFTALAVRANSATQSADLFQALPSTGTAKLAINAGGSLVIDDASKGWVVKDQTNSHYYRLTLQSGAINIADLGITRPSA